MSLNSVMLIGNLGADPEIRHTQDGRPIANLSVATSEKWKDKTTGEKREKTDWHRVVVFNEALCKVVEQYLKKGSKVYLQGQLQTRKWQDKDGIERYSTEVVMQGFNCKLIMLDSAGSGYKPGGDGAQDYGIDPDRAAGQSQSYAEASGEQKQAAGDIDDSIPFAPEWR